MKKLKYIALVLIFLTPSIYAENQIGLGVVIGGPTGISGSYKVSEDKTIDGALAFNSDLYTHGMYLFHKRDSLSLDKTKFGWYYGLGGQFHFKKDTSDNDDKKFFIGPRGAIGVNKVLEQGQFDLFAETALFLSIIPRTNVVLSINIGGRIFF